MMTEIDTDWMGVTQLPKLSRKASNECQTDFRKIQTCSTTLLPPNGIRLPSNCNFTVFGYL
jgi:hypothetical protein